MRSLDKTTRIVIATLYIRVRDAKRQSIQAMKLSGNDSPHARNALMRQYELQNTLQAAMTAVHVGVPSHGTPYEFIANVRQTAAVRSAARERDMLAA